MKWDKGSGDRNGEEGEKGKGIRGRVEKG